MNVCQERKLFTESSRQIKVCLLRERKHPELKNQIEGVAIAFLG